MSHVTKTSQDLTEEDLRELSVTRKGVRKVFFIVFPINILLIFLCFEILWLAILFIFIALVITLIYQYSERRFRKDTIQGIKYILEGPVQPLITISGGSVQARIDREKQLLHTKSVKGASTEEKAEPFVLGPGSRDRFFYALRMGEEHVLVDRETFLDFQPGERAHLEITPANTLIRYAKIR